MTLWIYLLFVGLLVLVGLGGLVTLLRVRTDAGKVIGGGLVLLVLTFFAYQHLVRAKAVAEAEARIVGTYILVGARSDLAEYPANTGAGLALTFTSDHRFTASKSVPFLPGQEGKWEHLVETNVQRSVLYFTDAPSFNQQYIQFSVWRDSLRMYNSWDRRGYPSTSLLMFARTTPQ